MYWTQHLCPQPSQHPLVARGLGQQFRGVVLAWEEENSLALLGLGGSDPGFMCRPLCFRGRLHDWPLLPTAQTLCAVNAADCGSHM